MNRHLLYAEEILALSGVRSPALKEALATVRREEFLPPGPWLVESMEGIYYQSEDADPRHVLHGVGVAIDPDRMLNNANPIKFVAQMQVVAPQSGETVFHVGAGLGYFSALFAKLVGPSGKVIAAEIDPDLREKARANLAGWPQVEVIGDALANSPPAFDLLYSSAGMGTLPNSWLKRLKIGGRMVLPITGPHDHGMVFFFQKSTETGPIAARMQSFTRHYPCLGTRGDQDVAALAQALRKPPSEVASLRLDPHETEDSCWLHGDGWCLSSKPPR
jgi:protein-L-isoaspartate(D-aspartate) O-methyltransferase